MKRPILLAIDLSFYSTGFSVWSKSGLIELGLIVRHKRKQVIYRDVNIYEFRPINNDHMMVACQVANILISSLQQYDISLIAIEDYAYGMFRSENIAEFTGIVKLSLRSSVCNDIITVPPTTVKKFVVHGRASKNQLVKKFKDEMGFEACSDVVDAYYIGKYVMEEVL